MSERGGPVCPVMTTRVVLSCRAVKEADARVEAGCRMRVVALDVPERLAAFDQKLADDRARAALADPVLDRG